MTRPFRMLTIAAIASLAIWWVLAKLGVFAYLDIRSLGN